MAYGFLAFFVLGLVLGVRAMLHGVERPGKARRPAERRFTLNLPTTAGFATAFGVTGYLLTHYTRLGPAADTVIAAVVGLAGAAGALALVAAWAIPAARAEVVDERYLLQGAFARVVTIADDGRTGSVVYESEGATHTARAAAVEGSRLEVGGDVVIDRIEDNVVYVESWARVEARL